MPSYIEPTVIDTNPTTLKPILFTTYRPITKYILDITYEDSTTKQVELVAEDRNRPYKVIFKKDGQLITATGVPKIYEINESGKFCDFVNKTLDSEDLLIELDCSSEYSCTKVRFYLKDIRDIIDLAVEGDIDNPEDIKPEPISKYLIHINGFDCKTKIRCMVDDDLEASLTASISKLGETLNKDQYSEFDAFVMDDSGNIDIFKYDNEGKFVLAVKEYLLDTEIKVVVRYFIKEIDHAVYDEFTIIPFKKSDDDTTKRTLDRAVSTADMQYLGDGLKPALGIGLTPGYKQYRNSKNTSKSVIE